jgi:hypothetical protein
MTDEPNLTGALIKELRSFNAAHLRLLLKVKHRPLRDVEMYLDDEAPQHVSIYCPDGFGHWEVVSFQLAEPSSEATFDPAPWIKMLEQL